MNDGNKYLVRTVSTTTLAIVGLNISFFVFFSSYMWVAGVVTIMFILNWFIYAMPEYIEMTGGYE